ncbi:MAG TPA: AAA family ATPase [Candidatus Nitrosotenuis sp.]|nr:AAA family ATPase [Candidatus Nitrosotenuis sp.]
MSQELIIIRGNSGSGKSTTAKKLQQEMGYETMLIQQDVVRREILRVRDTDRNPSIEMILDMALYGKHVGYDVIIEGILVNKRYGNMLRSIISEFDEVYVYYLDISFNETLRRHNLKPNAHEFGEKEMRDWWLERDLLGVEGELTITDDVNEDEVLHIIKKDLSLD